MQRDWEGDAAVALATSQRTLVSVRDRGRQENHDREEVRAALLRSPREIPSRFFYDDYGSLLFERICELPEYYQTRTEHALLSDVAGRLAAVTAASELVEIGSGAATKTRVLLDAMTRAGNLRLYVPIDFSAGTVRRVADELAGEYPELAVHGMVADFNLDLSPLPTLADGCPGCDAGHQRLVIFLGGTIGNLTARQAHDFLVLRHHEMASGDHFLLGVDLVKPVARLEAAYNDAAGITAEFNRNILRVVNQLGGAGNGPSAEALHGFDPAAFRHHAFYDAERRWIEMRLRAVRRQHVVLPDLDLDLDIAAGEEIHTEISSKYDRASAESLLAAAGFEPVEWFTDPEQLFGLALARRP
jgi:L-histidine N-alpha-methyltransferase